MRSMPMPSRSHQTASLLKLNNACPEANGTPGVFLAVDAEPEPEPETVVIASEPEPVQAEAAPPEPEPEPVAEAREPELPH